MRNRIKNYTAIISTLFVGIIAFSQQIDNANFQNWENVGSNNEEPTNWNSFYTASGSLTNYARKTVWRANGRSGAGYCAKIKTVSGSFGVKVNGNLTLGQVNMGSTSPANSQNHNATRINNAAFNQALTTRPDSIVFWAKYTPSGSDQAAISAIVHDNYNYTFPESGSSSSHAIAKALYSFGNTSVWKRISVPFSYSGTSTSNPAFILVNFTSSHQPGQGVLNSELLVDDVELIYNPKIITSSVSPLTYTVTNSSGSNISIPFVLENGPLNNTNEFTAQLSDANGNFGVPTNIGTLSSTTSGTISATIPAGTIAGTGYRVRVISNNPSVTGTENNANITINLIGNSISPVSSQSLLTGVDGSPLTVTENPVGTSREWKYYTTPNGTYQSFSPTETGTSYTPNFASSGSYYVACISIINGEEVISNKVNINVGTATITTGNLNSLNYEFSPSSPNGITNISFTTSGSFTQGNIFKAQLSDPNGSFDSPTEIGTLTSTTQGVISLNIPNTTTTGNNYRIRIVGTNPSIIGSDNGSGINIIQFSNSLSSNSTQNLDLNEEGNPLTVTENQIVTSRKWQFSQTDGSGYLDFNPAQTANNFTPKFSISGTFYVVCKSKNIFGDEVVSEQAIIQVKNGTKITTSSIIGSPFNLSPSANLVVPINFTSDVVFENNNQFKVELSDESGDFSSPTVIATLSSDSIQTINAKIPNTISSGNQYRIRVVSTLPEIIGKENENDLVVDQFSVILEGQTTQIIEPNTFGQQIIVNESQISTRKWKWSSTSGSGYEYFSPQHTLINYNPKFENEGVYYVVCESVNTQWGDTLISHQAKITIDSSIGINEHKNSSFKLINLNGIIKILTNSLDRYHFNLYSLSGKKVYSRYNQQNSQEFVLNIEKGIYVFEIETEFKTIKGKVYN